MSAWTHTEFVGSDWMSCRCILGVDHTREQYDAFYAEDEPEPADPSPSSAESAPDHAGSTGTGNQQDRTQEEK